MSDTKNTTEKSTDTKPVDTAAHKTINSTAKTSKSDMLIPLILLLVSAFVIFATFYNDEYNSLVAATISEETNAESDSVENLSEEPAIPAIAGKTNTETVAQAELTLAGLTHTAAEQDNASATGTSSAVEAASNTEASPATNAASATEISSASVANMAFANQQNPAQAQANSNVVAMQEQTASDHRRMQAANTPYQRSPYNRNPAKAHTQEQAQKYNEMMQQRRQAYEKEMETRRQQYEAAKKAQLQRRAEIMQAQKAAFQRMEQNHLETRKQIQDMHKRIAEMHKELHQIMRQSQTTATKPAAEQVQKIQ